MKINKDFSTVMRGSRRVAYWDRVWLKNRIREEQVSGAIAGSCFLIVVLTVFLFAIGGA